MDDATRSTALQDGICPWCSGAIKPDAATCPSCGAILISDDASDLPGITAIDPLVTRGVKTPPPRNRLLSWISGEYPESEAPIVDPQALAPPDPEVQREILRLEIEAEVANLQAEADALRSDALFEGRATDLSDELPEVTELIGEAQAAAAIPATSAAESTESDMPPTDEAHPPA